MFKHRYMFETNVQLLYTNHKRFTQQEIHTTTLVVLEAAQRPTDPQGKT